MTEPELNNLVGERSSLSVALDAIPLELIPRSQAVIPALGEVEPEGPEDQGQPQPA